MGKTQQEFKEEADSVMVAHFGALLKDLMVHFKNDPTVAGCIKIKKEDDNPRYEHVRLDMRKIEILANRVHELTLEKLKS